MHTIFFSVIYNKERHQMFNCRQNCVRIGLGKARNGTRRVLRGGNWNDNARNLRSAYRNHNTPDNRNHNIGLRLAGALLGALKSSGGSINQRFYLFCVAAVLHKQTQAPQRGSRHIAEPLLSGRLFYDHNCLHCTGFDQVLLSVGGG